MKRCVLQFGWPAILLAALPSVCLSAPLWWDGSEGNKWGNRKNWSTTSDGGSNPASGNSDPSAGNKAIFTASTATNLFTSLEAPRTPRGIEFNTTSTVTINPTSHLLDIGSEGILVNAGNPEIGAPILLRNTQRWRAVTGTSLYVSGTVNLSGNDLTIRGNGDTTVTGSILEDSAFPGGGLTKIGSGTVTLSGMNTYTGGTVIAEGKFIVEPGSNLGTGGITINKRGKLAGTPTIGSIATPANVTNSGRLIPGNSPGIIVINGNYTQTTTGTLEIEVGGLTPGPGSPNIDDGHDQLVVSGIATLGGRLEVPIINTDNFTPQIGNEITFLTYGSRVGTFDQPIAPNLEAIDPGLAFEAVYPADPTVAGAVKIRVVAKSTDINFISTIENPLWSDTISSTWTGNTLPAIANSITISNLSSDPIQTVHVDTAAVANELFIVGSSGATSSAFSTGLGTGLGTGASVGDEVVVTVGNGKSLLSQKKITVQDQGTLKIEAGGIVNAANILVEGGVLRGQGTVAVTSEILIGTGGTLSPGLNDVGSLTVDGNYTQGTDGVFEIDISSDGGGGAEQDTLGVTEDVSLSGTITIDTTALAEVDISPGDTFEIITTTGGTLNGKFDKIISAHRDDVYFDVTYEESSATVTAITPGDADGDGLVDGADAQAFAAALIDNTLQGIQLSSDPFRFATQNFVSAFDFSPAGSEEGVSFIDFDDIPGFVAAMQASQGISQSAAFATFEAAYADALNPPVPEPTSSTLIGFATILLSLRRRRNYPLPKHQIQRQGKVS